MLYIVGGWDFMQTQPLYCEWNQKWNWLYYWVFSVRANSFTLTEHFLFSWTMSEIFFLVTSQVQHFWCGLLTALQKCHKYSTWHLDQESTVSTVGRAHSVRIKPMTGNQDSWMKYCNNSPHDPDHLHNLTTHLQPRPPVNHSVNRSYVDSVENYLVPSQQPCH